MTVTVTENDLRIMRSQKRDNRIIELILKSLDTSKRSPISKESAELRLGLIFQDSELITLAEEIIWGDLGESQIIEKLNGSTPHFRALLRHFLKICMGCS